MNQGQVYQVKNCAVCKRKLEPGQKDTDICMPCFTILENLGAFMKSATGLLHVMKELNKRIVDG